MVNIMNMKSENKSIEPSPKLPSYDEILDLARLQFRIFDAGLDGGMLTSDAIEDLKAKEKEYGVVSKNWIELVKKQRVKDLPY